jgi:hypothetical protein
MPEGPPEIQVYNLATSVHNVRATRKCSSVEDGMPWPKVMAGVVRPARIPTTPRTSASAPLLIQGEPFSYLCRRVITCAFRSQWLEDSRCAFNVGARSLYRVWLLVWRRVVVFLPALYGFYYAEN